MPGSLEQDWIEKYRESMELVEETAEVFTGFNLNIDITHHVDQIPDTEPELKQEVRSKTDLDSSLRYCMENGENHEVDYRDLEVGNGERQIGGQGGIISDYLAKTGNEVILYTPSLSAELAELLDERILYPVTEDGRFYLKSVEDAVNSDKTKKNHIFEFEAEKTGRLILSGRLKGYGPYLPKNIQQELPLIESNIECCIFSGFHNVKGNKIAKLKRAAKQLEGIDKPIHLEYVHKDHEMSELITRYILPEVDSLGIDQVELEKLCSLLDIDYDKDLNFGKAFQELKDLREELGLERIHLHTYDFHITVADTDYPVETERIRDSMLFGELSAIKLADKGEIPEEEDLQEFEIKDKTIRGLQELNDFGDFHGLDSFPKEGAAEIDEVKVVGIPAITHQSPERTVGMGDIISSGAFSMENSS